jgi:hypothetical protein
MFQLQEVLYSTIEVLINPVRKINDRIDFDSIAFKHKNPAFVDGIFFIHYFDKFIYSPPFP